MHALIDESITEIYSLIFHHIKMQTIELKTKKKKLAFLLGIEYNVFSFIHIVISTAFLWSNVSKIAIDE